MLKRVVIVDDSRALRAWLRIILENDRRLTVVGEAANAKQARELIRETQPDVVTLDIEMPGMNGLEFLSRLMKLNPIPVVMVSAATRFGSEAAISALMRGAVDCVLKPGTATDAKASRDIARRVFSAACSKVPSFVKPRPPALSAPVGPHPPSPPLILIGASTGGVVALETVLRALPADGPPVVIVQHMPAMFLISFVQVLDRKLPQDVRMAADGAVVSSGQILFAPEQGYHTEISRRNGNWITQLRPNTERAAHCPSVDTLFASAAPFGHDVIATILTGLGRDGAEGLHQLHRSGARTLGQDQESSVVYGMPRAAWELGAVEDQVSLGDIGPTINARVQEYKRRPRKLAQ